MPDINADFGQRVLLHSADMPWIASPAAGVERRMLDRVGDEVARATSIVKYAPGSAFPRHTHTGGEEFLVLEGVFQDEHGDWPAGSYVRNPPTSSHTPGSEPGCVIFVKLWQFDPSDRTAVQLRPSDIESTMRDNGEGIHAALLHRDTRETVTLEKWSPGVSRDCESGGGCEILVLSGALFESGDTIEAGGWLRLPAGYHASLSAGSDGCRLWLKRGHMEPVLYPHGPVE